MATLRRCWRRRAFCSQSQSQSQESSPTQPSCSPRVTSHPSALSEIVDQVCSILDKQTTWSPELEQALAAAAPNFHSQLLFHVLKAQKYKPDLAWSLFHWAARRRGFRHTQAAYCRLIDIMARAEMYDAAWSLIDAMGMSGIPLTPVPFTTLIYRYAGDGRLDEAEGTFQRMLQHGCKPNVHTFNALMRAQTDAGKANAAVATFSVMTEQGCTPDVVTYTTLIRGLCQLGKIDRAAEILEEMRGKGCPPNKRAFDTLILGQLNAGQRQKALSTLDDMDENGCPPDSFTYNFVLRSFFEEGQLENVSHVLDQMGEKQCAPDWSSHDSIVSGFCTGSTMHHAGVVFLKRVIEMWYNLDLITCISLEHWLCHQAPSDQAADILEWLMSRETHASGSHYAELMEWLFTFGKEDLIVAALKQLMAKGFLPNMATCIGVVNRLSRVVEAEAWVDQVFRPTEGRFKLK